MTTTRTRTASDEHYAQQARENRDRLEAVKAVCEQPRQLDLTNPADVDPFDGLGDDMLAGAL